MNHSAKQVLALLERHGALTPKAIARALGLPRLHARTLRRTLHELVREGRIARIDRGRYGLLAAGREIEGRVVRDRRGHGRVGSVVVPRDEMRSLKDGDRVRLRLEGPPGKVRGRVIGVVQRARPVRAGVVRQGPRGTTVLPYRDRRHWQVRLPSAQGRGLRDGEVVLVEVDSDGEGPARLLRVLGEPGSRDVDVQAVAAAHDIPVDFPEDVALEASERAALGIPGEEIARRVDLREERIITIDGEDARDFDDAVSVTPLPNGRFRLLVSIADVSYYVEPATALDREALHRGNSVYFPDRAIPMLPEPLSSDVCSLRPGVDRLAVTVEMVLDREGRPESSRFFESVIRSRERMTYDQVAGLLEGARPEWVLHLETLAGTLIRRREREGSIDFDLPEPEVRLDAEGRLLGVRPRQRTLAHRIIEEFMLAANRAVAEKLSGSGSPVLYRVHEEPHAERLEAVAETFAALGIPVRALGAPEIAAAVRKLRGRPQIYALQALMLRAMKQARYSVENLGHFALNFPRYVHFTSPIRRYADLTIHRILKVMLERSSEVGRELASIAGRTSERERAAMEAERAMADIYHTEFMVRHLGDVLAGWISGVARPGLFVTVEPALIEGIVPASSLPDRYELDARGLALIGRRRGERLALGDRVRVRVDAVDPLRCSVVLALVG